MGHYIKRSLGKEERRKLGDLLANHRQAPGVADYDDSPTMSAVFEYVEYLLAREANRVARLILKEAERALLPKTRY